MEQSPQPPEDEVQKAGMLLCHFVGKHVVIPDFPRPGESRILNKADVEDASALLDLSAPNGIDYERASELLVNAIDPSLN
jgi:hypothetical protein